MKNQAYRSILVDEITYNNLNNLKRLTEMKYGRKISFGDFINENISKRAKLFSLESDLQEYLIEATGIIGKNPKTLGIVLFGSVAKGTFGKHSDIDLMIVADTEDKLDFIDEIRLELKSIEGKRKKMVRKGWLINISPLILSPSDLDAFSPLFLDIVDYGIILLQKDTVIDNFFSRINSIRHNRKRMGDGEVLTWRG